MNEKIIHTLQMLANQDLMLMEHITKNKEVLNDMHKLIEIMIKDIGDIKKVLSMVDIQK